MKMPQRMFRWLIGGTLLIESFVAWGWAERPTQQTDLVQVAAPVEAVKPRAAAVRDYPKQAQNQAFAPAPEPVERDPSPTALDAEGEEQPFTELSLKYDGETADPAWSKQLASRLASISTNGSSLRLVECRTTLCKIETRHSDIAAFNLFVDAAFLRNADPSRTLGAVHFADLQQSPDGTLTASEFLSR